MSCANLDNIHNRNDWFVSLVTLKDKGDDVPVKDVQRVDGHSGLGTRGLAVSLNLVLSELRLSI